MRLLSTLVRGKRGGRGEEGALGSKMVGRVLGKQASRARKETFKAKIGHVATEQYLTNERN